MGPAGVAVPDEEAEAQRGEGMNVSGKMPALIQGESLPFTLPGDSVTLIPKFQPTWGE